MKVILKSLLDDSTIGAVPVFSSVHYLSVGGRSFFFLCLSQPVTQEKQRAAQIEILDWQCVLNLKRLRESTSLNVLRH